MQGQLDLAAADRVAKDGDIKSLYMTVMTVLEGYLTYGIPGFKLEKEDSCYASQRIFLKEGGVNFELNTNIWR